jgi:hypothetical protein
MRPRCSERSGAFGAWDLESLEVPKRLSGIIEAPSLVLVTLLLGGMEGCVSFAGWFSAR